jgi:hypothetical protein
MEHHAQPASASEVTAREFTPYLATPLWSIIVSRHWHFVESFILSVAKFNLPVFSAAASL